MNKNYIKGLFIFFMLLLPVTGLAQSKKVVLTLDDAVNTGLTNNKSLHSSLMKVKYSEAKANEADAAKYATLKFNASYRRLSKVDPFAISTPFGNFEISPSILDNYSASLSLAQPLFVGNKITKSAEIAEENIVGAKADYSKDQIDFALTVKNSYWNLKKAMLMKNVLDTTVAQIKVHLADAKNMVKAGLLTQNDLLKIEVQLSDAEFKVIDAENSVQLAMMSLNNTIGLPLNTEIEFATNQVPLGPTKLDPVESLIKEALDARPDIKSLESKAKVSESAIEIAKGGWYPTVSAFANYYYQNPNQRIVPSKAEFAGTWDAGVSLSFDVWNWKTTTYQTEQAEANLMQLNDGISLTKDGISLEVSQAHLSFGQSVKKIALAEFSVKQAEENRRTILEKFKAGTALTSDLVDAESALLQAKTNHTNALIDCRLADAKLAKALGKLN